MLHNEQPSNVYQSYGLSSYYQNAQQQYMPVTKMQNSRREHSPFQSLNEETFIQPRQQILYHQHQKLQQLNLQQGAYYEPQMKDLIPIKEYLEKPFAKIPQFKIAEIQIIIPQQTARFHHNEPSVLNSFRSQEERGDKSPREGIKKKKISIVTKTFTSKSQES